MSKVVVLRNVGDIDVVAGIAMKIYYEAGDWVESGVFLDELIDEYTRQGRSTDNTSGGQGIAKMKPALYYGLIEYKKEEGHNYHRLTEDGKKFYEAYCNSDEDQMVDIILHCIPGRSFGQYNDAVPESASEIDPPKVFLVATLIFGGISKVEYAYLLQELGKGRSINSLFSEIAISRTLNTELQLTKYSKNNYKDDKGIQFLCKAGLTDDNSVVSAIKEKYVRKYSSLLGRISVLSTYPRTAKQREEAFELYLNEKTDLLPSTIEHYLKDIKKDLVIEAVKTISDNQFESIYQVDYSSMAEEVKNLVMSDPRNRGDEEGYPGSACTQYVAFLKMWDSRLASGARSDSNNDGLQTIFYGAPGTGKSYKIKTEIIPQGVVPYRVAFYSDYYYSDFVGGLKPHRGEGGIDYKFEPGPFAEALRDSFTKPTYLIIEEINRGNAAAIFGDIFQLLDREKGHSEYSITNPELYNYLVKEGVSDLEENKVYLPAGLNILCTMNTADQNVFVLDTAFKRRFRMEYVPIDFKSYFENGVIKESCRGYIENTSIFVDDSYNPSLKELMTPEIYRKVQKVITNPSRNWPTFAAYINARIDSINSIEQKISEDKKLGPFFVEMEELLDRKTFTDKVIYYLKQDVFKYEDELLNESYEVLYDEFVNNNRDFFCIFEPID